MCVYASEVTEFAARVRAFVVWCETFHTGDRVDAFLSESLQHLANVYSGALMLPCLQTSDAPDPPKVTPEKRVLIAKNLSTFPFQYYWEVLNPSELSGNKDPVCGDLLDDFLDIHQTLSEGLWLYDQDCMLRWPYSLGG